MSEVAVVVGGGGGGEEEGEGEAVKGAGRFVPEEADDDGGRGSPLIESSVNLDEYISPEDSSPFPAPESFLSSAGRNLR